MRCIILFLLLGQADDPKTSFLQDYEEPAKAISKEYRSIYAKYEMESAGEVIFKETGEAWFTFDHFRASSESSFIAKDGTPLGKSEGLSIVRNSQYGFILGGQKIVKLNVRNDAVRPLFELTIPYCDYQHRETYFGVVKSGTANVIEWKDRRLVYWSIRPDLETGKRMTKTKTSVQFNDNWLASVVITHDDKASNIEDSWTEKRLNYEGLLLAGFTEWGYYDGVLKMKRSGRMLEFKQVEPLPAASFRLTAFGISEPDGVTWPSPLPFYWYFFLGAIILAALTYFLRKNSR